MKYRQIINNYQKYNSCSYDVFIFNINMKYRIIGIDHILIKYVYSYLYEYFLLFMETPPVDEDHDVTESTHRNEISGPWVENYLLNFLQDEEWFFEPNMSSWCHTYIHK